MASNQSSCKSAPNCIDNSGGYSLKKRELKDWIYDHGKTQPYIAKRLGITKEELQRKLNEHELFDEQQIRSLVYLVGAETAIDIIYFPTLKEKRKVWRKTFGKQRKEEDEQLNERSKKTIQS